MSSCGGCDRRWYGTISCHCAACHEHFGSVRAFDAHRVGPVDTRHCVDPGTLRRKDGNPMFDGAGGKSGDVWTLWDPRPHPGVVRRAAELASDGNGHPVQVEAPA